MSEWSIEILTPQDGVIVVDNRIFLLGLDVLYRNAMKGFESDRLLDCARRVAQELNIQPADGPIEGYYTETPKLEEYFRLMRSLQEVEERQESTVHNMEEFQLLWELTNSPIYGRPQRAEKLLPKGRDPLSQALKDAANRQVPWRADSLVMRAHQAAQEYDDISLVGLAARAKDSIMLAALRESVVLYAEDITLGPDFEPKLRYVWQVDAELTHAANRFIQAFNHFVPGGLPDAEATNAEVYYKYAQDNDFIGRCVRIGQLSEDGPYYHWGIYYSPDRDRRLVFRLDEFWSPILWTTQLYRKICRGNSPHQEADDLLAQEQVEKAHIQEIKINSSEEENLSISSDGSVNYRCPKCHLLFPNEILVNMHIKISHT
jgi:hypothetical protein